MSYETIVRYDPGGNGAHGIATLGLEDEEPVRMSTCLVLYLSSLSSIISLGVDTLTCWGTGHSGWRAQTDLREGLEATHEDYL